LATFINNLFKNYGPEISNYRQVQALIEANFEKIFNPEFDQIDYMRK